jgi:hypothetical protein
MQRLALTLPTSSGRSIGIVHSRTKATELLLDTEMFKMMRDEVRGIPHEIMFVLCETNIRRFAVLGCPYLERDNIRMKSCN